MPVDMALHDAVTVPRANRCLHCVYIAFQSIGKLTHFAEAAGTRLLEPSRKTTPLALGEHGVTAGARLRAALTHGNEVIREPLRCSDRWTATAKGVN